MSYKEDNKAPLFKNWNGWYILVISFLVFLIIIFTLFTRYFS